MVIKMKRYEPSIDEGLNSEQVQKRIEEGLFNYDTEVKTKTIPRIIVNNIFTLFNMLNLFLAILIFSVGSYKNLLFLGVVICNTIISTFQEIRSKIIVDKLSIVSRNKVKVVRNGKIELVEQDNIVLDDIVVLKAGDQVLTDSIILDGNVMVDESFITGESDSVELKVGDMLKSGSFITVGNCKAKVEHVGVLNYTSMISKDAKYVKKINSILMKSLNQIIKIVSIAIVPVGILLFINQYNLPNATIEGSIINTVAALIGMIPEGLVLLTSTVLAVSVIRLAKLNVLVQELYCIEMLARVDTICLDKTGTITDGVMNVKEVFNIDKFDLNEVIGNMINNINDDNMTIKAIKKHFNKFDNYEVKHVIPFSPVYKYSGVSFKEKGTFIMGAPEFIYDKKIKKVEDLSKEYRVLLVMHSSIVTDKNELPKDLKPIGIITIEDNIRTSAFKTINYFKEQGVDIKIISGDNVNTVSLIAKRAGLDDIRAIDVSKLSDEELKEAVLKYNIFGRVTPIQKKQMVIYLKEAKHVVAMTGDGVNDVLALKEADCSIALASGSDATRNVSQLVLLDSNFDALPKVVAEGRRTINNIERSASLFTTKTSYAFLLAILFVFVDWNYPFVPIQLTLTSVFTIGIPAFILALEPNEERITGNFLLKVFGRALPSAITIVLNIIIVSIIGRLLNVNNDQISTLSVIMTGFTGFLLLTKICKPFNLLRIGLLVTMISGFIIGVVGFKSLFSLTLLSPKMLLLMIILVIMSLVLFNFISIFTDKLLKKQTILKVGE